MTDRARRALTAAVVLGLVLSALLRAPDTTQLLQFTILGVAAGAVYAIAASGVVLTYATTGVFNFAHGGLGMVAAFAFWQLTEQWDLPVPLAVLFVLGVLGPAVGCALELMFRGLRNADVGAAIVLTVAVTVLCIGLAQYAFKPYEAHNLEPIIAGTVRVFDATITWDDVLKMGTAVAIAIGLRILLFRTRAGTTMRAVVDDPALAALNGASSTAVARGSWILGTELAMVAGILIGAGANLDAITLTFFVVNAYGAAVFGRLRSLPLTVVGAMALGLAQSWGAAFWFPKGASSFALADGEHWRRIGLSLPGIFLFVALLFLPQARLAAGRRIRRTHPAVPGLRASVLRAVGFVAVVGVVARLLPEEHLGDATRALVFAVILLSLVVLTGYSGQVSLAQYVFVAIGAWAMGSVLGGSSPLGVLAAAVAPVALAVVVALPALRLQGLYLALVTFGFASVSRDLIIQDRVFFGGDPVEVGRPSLLGVSFEGDRAFVVLCAVVFALVGIGVLALRRGRLGRQFAAVRDSEAACATLGLDPRRTRLLAFCLSASIAGVGGALFGGSQLTVSDIPFEPINNIVLLLFAVVGGVTTVSGALIGGVLFALLPYVQSREPALAGLVFAGIAGVAISLGRHPDGLAGLLARVPHLAGLRLRRAPRLALVGMLVVLAVVGGTGAPAMAQDGGDPFAGYGGFNAAARAGGVQVSYDVQGVLPLPPPLLQVTVPTARATTATGPTSVAFGSLAYPGDLIGNLPALAEQASPGSGALVPPYPVAVLADFPAGPATKRQDIGTANAVADASVDGAHAVATLAASSIPGVLEVGTVTTSSRTGTEDGLVAARARTEVAEVSLLGGLVELHDVVIDVVAASDGTTGRSRGTTSVGSASILGLPAELGPDGLGPVASDPLAAVTDAAGELLAAAGIQVSLSPLALTDDGAGARAGGAGIAVTFAFDGSSDSALGQLLALVPSDDLPGSGIPGVPINTSPQALVNLLKESHVASVELATATASVDAAPGFEDDDAPDVTLRPDTVGPRLPGPSSPPVFTTPLPDLGAAPAPAASSRGGLVPGRAVGALVVALALLSLPAWFVGSAKLMDASLEDTAPPCAGTSTGGVRDRRRPG